VLELGAEEDARAVADLSEALSDRKLVCNEQEMFLIRRRIFTRAKQFKE